MAATIAPTIQSTDGDDGPAALRVGVLLLPTTQLLDLSAIDLFGMLNPSYLRACRLPTAIANLGVPIAIHYISVSPFPTSGPAAPPPLVALTAAARLALTASVADPRVAPGRLNILLVPGPDPALPIPDDARDFVRDHAAHGAVLLSVCTGVLVLAESGVLQGLQATAPRPLVAGLRGKWPGVKWVERRWCTDKSGDGDGKVEVWTSGGITNGLDMVAAFLKEKYPGPLSDTVCALADVGDRRQDYKGGKVRENSWWLWTIFRAWLAGV